MTLADRMTAIERELAALVVEMREARADIAAIDKSINGPPRDGSTIRDRLHKLETDSAAARAASAAVEAIKMARDSGAEAVRVGQRRMFGTAEKTILFGFSALLGGAQIARWFGVG